MYSGISGRSEQVVLHIAGQQSSQVAGIGRHGLPIADQETVSVAGVDWQTAGVPVAGVDWQRAAWPARWSAGAVLRQQGLVGSQSGPPYCCDGGEGLTDCRLLAEVFV